MGRRSAYSSAPQNVCDAVKRKDIVCLPARSHTFNHEAKMLACKGIFARPSMPSPCRRHGWGQSPRRLQSSIRRRQFYHEAKMCARTDIFARPSMSHRAAYYAARAAARRRLLAFARSHVTIITHPTLSVNDAKLRAAITLSAFRNIIPLNMRKG